jgi:hypothetical protein
MRQPQGTTLVLALMLSPLPVPRDTCRDTAAVHDPEGFSRGGMEKSS